MKLQDALMEVLNQPLPNTALAKIQEHGYSGRGMMGRMCPAISGSWAQCQAFCAAVLHVHMNALIEQAEILDQISSGKEYDAYVQKKQELSDLTNRLWDFSTDQLGYDIVMYWPHEEYVRNPPTVRQMIGDGPANFVGAR